MKNGILISIISLIFFTSCESSGKLTEYVNPLLGSATLWDKKDLGYERHKKTRTWGAETYPGTTLPNAMVQVSPVTQFRSGSGYQYEDSVIYGFSHTNKGHWNLLHVPIMPVVGDVTPSDYCSSFSHRKETARPGYYQVYLDRYKVNVELTSTLRCAYHKYTFSEEDDKSVLVDIRRSNNAVTDWHIEKSGDKVFTGYQAGEGKIYFYATTNYAIKDVAMLKDDKHEVALVNFVNSKGKKPLELKIGFSFVSIENAKMNLEYEMLHKDFAQVAREADHTWEKLLSKIQVSGGTEREKRLFYSCLYHSFKWPALRSDVNFEYTD
jgi:predicted alpha-1,2-mannosidase